MDKKIKSIDKFSVKELYQLMTQQQTAEFLSVTTRCLEKWRFVGGGPKYVKLSSRCVRYRLIDLIEYQQSKLKRNTCE